MKFLQTIRVDASDAHVFLKAAEPGEWAVSGATEFAHLPPETIAGKTKQAFANGFLGLASFGRSTLTAVAEMTEKQREISLDALMRYFVSECGAPDEEVARSAAEAEFAFVEEMCAGQQVNTMFAVSREIDGEGRIREAVRIVAPPDGKQHARVWEIVEDDA